MSGRAAVPVGGAGRRDRAAGPAPRAVPAWRSPAFPLATAAALAPALAVLQSKAMAPLSVLCLLLCVVAARRGDGAWPWPPGGATWAGMALAAWGALSASWAIEPERALAAAGQLGGLVLLAAAAARAVSGRPESRALIGRALAAGLPVGLVLALADHWSGNGVRMAVRGLEHARPGLEFGLKPAASVMALLLPMLLAVPASRVARSALLLGGTAALLMLPGDTAKIAGLAGVTAALLAARWPRRSRPAVAVLAAALVLGGPGLAGVLAGPALAERLPFTAVHRLVIWDHALARAAERPLLGWGMEGSRALPGGRDVPDEATLDRVGVHGADRARLRQPGVEALPLHPHNAAVQLLLELGWPGLALAAGLVAALCLAATDADPDASTDASTGASRGVVLSGLVTALLSFGAWQFWWMATQALAVALAAGLLGRETPRPPLAAPAERLAASRPPPNSASRRGFRKCDDAR